MFLILSEISALALRLDLPISTMAVKLLLKKKERKEVCVFGADQEDNYQTIRIRNSLLIFDLRLVIERGSKCPAPEPSPR